jgi:hypothetical protein
MVLKTSTVKEIADAVEESRPPVGMNFVGSFKMIPTAIEIDRNELKRLKAHKLISIELYVSWALILTYGENEVKLDDKKMDDFCNSWSFPCCEYIADSKAVFNLLADDVLIAIGKLSKKQGSGVECSLQLTLNLGLEG